MDKYVWYCTRGAVWRTRGGLGTYKRRRLSRIMAFSTYAVRLLGTSDSPPQI